MAQNKKLSISVPQLLHLCNERNNGTYFIELLGGLNDLFHAKCLIHSQHWVSVVKVIKESGDPNALVAKVRKLKLKTRVNSCKCLKGKNNQSQTTESFPNNATAWALVNQVISLFHFCIFSIKPLPLSSIGGSLLITIGLALPNSNQVLSK